MLIIENLENTGPQREVKAAYNPISHNNYFTLDCISFFHSWSLLNIIKGTNLMSASYKYGQSQLYKTIKLIILAICDL